MALKWVPPNLDDLVERYLTGQSVASLARQEEVSRQTVANVLVESGVRLRTLQEASQSWSDSLTPDQKRANAEAAHAAIRGTRRSHSELEMKAKIREKSAVVVSPYEILFASWIEELNLTPQCAVGKYNLDFASRTVAVEIFGGNFHSFGSHAARHPDRLRTILDSGRLLITVWCNRRKPLTPCAAHYVISAAKLTKRSPALRGQYRVIWGTGEDVTALCPDFDKTSAVPPQEGGVRCRTCH